MHFKYSILQSVLNFVSLKVRSRYNPTWGCWSDGFLVSLEAEGVLVRHVVVCWERSPTGGGGRATQLHGGETRLSRAGAWPSPVPKRKLLPGSVDGVPGTCGRVSDSLEVMVTVERVIRAWDVLTVHRQSLSQVPDRLGVVHFLRPGADRCVNVTLSKNQTAGIMLGLPAFPGGSVLTPV